MNGPSLLTERSEQLQLLSSSEMDGAVFAEEEGRGVFTGERLFARDPERYRTVVALLAEGLGVRAIARLLKLSTHTVQAIREREPAAIATLKQQLVSVARSTAQLCLEGLRDLLADASDDTGPDSDRKAISAKDRAIILGILVDKSEMLATGLTSRVGIVAADAPHDAYNRWLDSIEVEASPAMRCGGNAAGQKAIGEGSGTNGAGSSAGEEGSAPGADVAGHGAGGPGVEVSVTPPAPGERQGVATAPPGSRSGLQVEKKGGVQ